MWRKKGSGDDEATAESVAWERRPGGMLVQKRCSTSGDSPAAASASMATVVRVRVVYGAARHEVSVSSQVTFGELKKVLAGDTDLQPADQRLLYKGKERGNCEYLDTCGVKNRSKIILMEDVSSVERRYLERRRMAKMESINRAISDTSMEIDKLGDQVAAIGKTISNGTKVADEQISTLVEMLMRQAVVVEGIPAEGEAAFKKTLQAKRVQKFVETLDALKVSNDRVKPVFVSTKWETFESLTTSPWEFFD
ncbi:unnamed protein product [Spirodela intermedia]|uniref:Ubiquitin-like domain-containing protein n=1 Tax=Spirodela intermedia TaxID=51605 RepID=A0A7I8LJ69_SPIIN|nr:unnamed protein product [Spirodela intermedia]